MEKMNKRNQDREESYGMLSEKPGEYVSFVDGSNVMQL